MGKGKSKNKNTKRGPPSHFTGFKKAFLISREAAYQLSMDTKTTTAFYNKVTRDFVAKYGQQEPFHKEFVDEPPDPEDGDEDESESTSLSNEEAAENALLFTKLRTVSCRSECIRYRVLKYLQKLSQWYRRMYKRPEATKGGDSSSANPFTSVMAANIEKAPRKLAAFQWYYKMYYKSRMKDEYLRRFAVATKKYKEASPEEKETLNKPIPVQIRSEIVREFWNLETVEYREQMARDAEEAHSKAFEDWEQLKQVPKTAQQFHQYVVSSQYVSTPDLT
jgi:hypothetical protein